MLQKSVPDFSSRSPARRRVGRSARRDGACERGAAAVEFALVLPVVLALLVGMLELGLTGADDQVLVRRVLTPSMLGAPDVLAPAEAWEGRVQLNLMSPLAVTGYRAALFAP